MTKPLFALAYKRKSESPVTKSDAMRLKLYIAAFIRSNRNKKGVSAEELSKSIWCTVEHLFDNHDLCSEDFCWKLKQKKLVEGNASTLSSNEQYNTENNRAALLPTHETNNGRGSDNICLPTNDIRSSKVSGNLAVSGNSNQAVCSMSWNSEKRTQFCRHLESEEGEDAEHEERSPKVSNDIPIHKLRGRRGYYRDKKLHHVAYSQIKKVLEPYFEMESIQQLMHGFDTQKNESLNTTVSYVAPKNRHLCSSIELSVRVAIIAASVSIGTASFVARILETCGIPTSNNRFLESLEKEDTKKLNKRKREQSSINRRKRAKLKYESMKHDRQEEVKARENGTTYGELKQKKPPIQRQSCRYSQYGCMSENGHRTASSNSCKFHDLYMQFEAKKGKKEKFDEVVKNLESERHSFDSHNQKTGGFKNSFEQQIFEQSNESINECDMNEICKSQLHNLASNTVESHPCTQQTQEISHSNSKEEQSPT